MKRTFLKMAMTLLLTALPAAAGAQSVLGGLLDKLGGKNASGAIGEAVSALLGKDEVKQSTIVGTWTYDGPAIVFESENIANKLGGKLLSSKGEDMLATQLEKIGMKPGAVKITFNADSTYTCLLGSRTTRGTYEVKDATLSLKKLNFTTLKTNAKVSGSELQLAVEADKILTLVSSLSNLSGSNSMLSTVTNFMKGYDGMQVGVKFKKE